MADYYPLIARAISGLDANAPGESRRALYERARDALTKQLRSAQPPLIESEITRERLSLEEAIRMVESEAAERARNPVRQRFGPMAGVGTDAEFDREPPAWKETLYASISLPPASVIPEQDERRAIAFRLSSGGALDLKPDKSASALDPEQAQLYSRLRSQLLKIKEDIPSQERQQIDAIIDDFLDQPRDWEQVEFKKILWLCGNALRTCLASHDAVSTLQEPHYSKLPLGVAEALRKPVETWNVFTLGDEELIELDAGRLGPKEQAATIENLQAARPILEIAAADRAITTDRAGKALTTSLKIADSSRSDLNTKQAQDLAERTSRNFIAQLFRIARKTVDEITDPKTDEANQLQTEFKRGVANQTGKTTVIAAAALVATSAWPVFEFVAAHADQIRVYLAAAYQNDQMIHILNAIEMARTRVKLERSLTE